jgi:very-short-patch-repair endonuclease
MRRRARVDQRTLVQQGAAADKLSLARAMRAAPTSGEAFLWAALRARQLAGWKFRRQQVLAGYVVDFYCAELALAVEVDGPIHQQCSEHDRQRDADLAQLGVDTMRLRDADVRANLNSVLRAISARCEWLADAHGCSSVARRPHRKASP